MTSHDSLVAPKPNPIPTVYGVLFVVFAISLAFIFVLGSQGRQQRELLSELHGEVGKLSQALTDRNAATSRAVGVDGTVTNGATTDSSTLSTMATQQLELQGRQLIQLNFQIQLLERQLGVLIAERSEAQRPVSGNQVRSGVEETRSRSDYAVHAVSGGQAWVVQRNNPSSTPLSILVGSTLPDGSRVVSIDYLFKTVMTDKGLIS